MFSLDESPDCIMQFDNETSELGTTEKEIKSAWGAIFRKQKDSSSSRGISCTECDYVIPQKTFKSFYAHLTEKHFEILAQGLVHELKSLLSYLSLSRLGFNGFVSRFLSQV